MNRDKKFVSGPDLGDFDDSTGYKLVFNKNGKLDVFKKMEGKFKHIGDLDDFYFINNKPVVTEVKTMPARNLDVQIKDGLATSVVERLNAVKEVTGETPEFIIMVPKGEAALSKELSNFIKDIKNAGFKNAVTIELSATNAEFEKAARRIFNETKQGKVD